jgi:hypothetical protein
VLVNNTDVVVTCTVEDVCVSPTVVLVGKVEASRLDIVVAIDSPAVLVGSEVKDVVIGNKDVV